MSWLLASFSAPGRDYLALPVCIRSRCRAGLLGDGIAAHASGGRRKGDCPPAGAAQRSGAISTEERGADASRTTRDHLGTQGLSGAELGADVSPAWMDTGCHIDVVDAGDDLASLRPRESPR